MLWAFLFPEGGKCVLPATRRARGPGSPKNKSSICAVTVDLACMASTYSLMGLALPRMAASFAICYGAFASAQGSTTPATTPTTPPLTFVDELEPNDARQAATPVTFTGPMTRMRGRTTGASGLGDASPDFWNISLTGINPLAITLHRLIVDVEPQGLAPGPLGHTGVVMATRINQSTTPPTRSDNLLQYTTISSNPPRASIFYSINASSLNFDYRMTGTNSTSTRYLVNWQSEVVTPEIIAPGACPFPIGPVKITTIGQGHTTDTVLFVFDATTFQLIAQMDNPPLPNSPRQAELTVNLGEGRYILAVAPSGLATDSLPPANDLASQAVNQIVLPSAGMYVHPSAAVNVPLTFRISSAQRNEVISARRTQAFAVQFYQFSVQYLPRCGDGDLASQGVGLCPDGVLDNNDFIRFIDLFFAKAPEANLVRVPEGTTGVPEAWDNDDLVAFIQYFFTPCAQAPVP